MFFFIFIIENHTSIQRSLTPSVTIYVITVVFSEMINGNIIFFVLRWSNYTLKYQIVKTNFKKFQTLKG